MQEPRLISDDQRGGESDVPYFGARFWWLVLAIIVTGIVARLPRFWHPIWGEPQELHPFRQAQTLVAVREIMRTGMDLSGSLPILGPPWVVPMEFPTYQNFAALLGVGLGMNDVVASRVATLIIFQLCAVALVILAVAISGKGTALIALVVWEFTPLMWFWSSQPTIEFLAVLFAALGVWLSLLLARSQRNQWVLVLASLVWVFAFLSKFTTALVWMPFLVGAIVATARVKLVGVWLRALFPVLIGGLCGLLWVVHSDAVKARSPFTEFLTSRNLSTWNFGTLQQRLDLNQWQTIATHVNGIAGLSLAFLALSVSFIFWRRNREAIVVAGGLFSILAAISAFFNLYAIHSYYSIATAPIIAIVIGVMGQHTLRVVRERRGRLTGLLTVGVALIALLGSSWLFSEAIPTIKELNARQWRYGQSGEIAASTKSTDGVVVVGCSWSSEVLYFADRRGLMLQDTWPVGNMQHKIPISWLESELGFVYLCSNSYEVAPLFAGPVEVVAVSPNLYRVRPAGV